MEKIAIVGMGCLLPGYTTKGDLWDKLIAGDCLMTNDTYNEKIIERGHLYRKDSDEFFKKYFSVDKFCRLNGKGEIYKWSSYVVEEALKDSGYIDDKDVLQNTGIIMGTLGMFVPEYISIFDKLVKTKLDESINLLLEDGTFQFDNSNFNGELASDKCYVDTDNVNTIRELYNLQGPYMSVSAACATPLYAIKLGCLYLQTHKTDMMVVGSNCENESISDVCGIFDLLSILVEEGMCNPLNSDSKGLIISSGAGAVVLKRLNDAVRDKDQILAVIDNIGWSNDGGAKSLLAPCMEGQIASFEDAYSGDISANIDYIECHSTGTAAGDLEEYKSIRTFFGERGFNPYIGTIKGNTGHFLTASAMGSIVKVILSMQHSVIPQTIRVDKPIGSEVVTKNISWPKKGREKRAAVNAFGFGGINAHMVLKEYVNEEKQQAEMAKNEQEIAIVGMDLQIGEVHNKETFFEYLLHSKTAVIDDGTNRFSGDEKNKNILKVLGIDKFPKGAYINEIPFDFLKFKFPAKQDMYYARRDMLLLNVANRALIDADITIDSMKDTAVIINAGQDFAVLNYRVSLELRKQIIESFDKTCPGLSIEKREQIFDILRNDEECIESADSIVGIIPTIRGSRISSHWHFKGPSFILTEQEEAFEHSIEIAKILLNNNIVKCVVIGTVELLGETELLYAQKINGTMSNVIKNGIGEGAGVIVLKNKEQALKDHNTIYATIEDTRKAPKEFRTELIENTAGYIGSLQQYVELIVEALEKYYRFPLDSNISTESLLKENILHELSKKMSDNDIKINNESKRNFTKNIKTSLPKLVERESFKNHIHKIIYEKLVNQEEIVDHDSMEKSLFYKNYEQYVRILERQNREIYNSLMNNKGLKKKSCIWDRNEIIEMTEGKMSKFLGPQYEIADQYEIRSRMPLPPYLFITRITKIDAEFGKLRPSMIEIEYDVDDECIYLQGDNTISNVVFTEASQIGIFLGAYIGADVTQKETLRFRVVDSKITFMNNIPVCLGDTLRLVYRMDRFINRGETLIVFCSYECYSRETLILKTDAIGGFFTEQDLQGTKGIIAPRVRLENKQSMKKLIPNKIRRKEFFDNKDLTNYFNGKLRECFEDVTYKDSNLLRYIRPEVRMLDTITEINFSDGKYGLGHILGKKKIDATHWAFKAHFKNDPVFPGTLILNGANQLLLFFAIYCGFIEDYQCENIGAIEELTVDVAFRGQVKPKESEIIYKIDIKDIIGQSKVEGLVAEINVYWEDLNVIREDNISLKF